MTKENYDVLIKPVVNKVKINGLWKQCQRSPYRGTKAVPILYEMIKPYKAGIYHCVMTWLCQLCLSIAQN